jgi:hypothetical protein
MGGETLDHIEVFRKSNGYTDVDERRLGPLKVRECTVEIMAALKSETGPEIRTGCEDRTPILTDVRGFNKILLAGAILENPGQYLWRKPVYRNKRVPDRPNRLRNLREITFYTVDL